MIRSTEMPETPKEKIMKETPNIKIFDKLCKKEMNAIGTVAVLG